MDSIVQVLEGLEDCEGCYEEVSLGAPAGIGAYYKPYPVVRVSDAQSGRGVFNPNADGDLTARYFGPYVSPEIKPPFGFTTKLPPDQLDPFDYGQFEGLTLKDGLLIGIGGLVVVSALFYFFKK